MITEENFKDPNDLFEIIKPFRIFRIKDFNCEPILMKDSEAWINSTIEFPRKYENIRKIYESEFIKVDLFKKIKTGEQVQIGKLD